jgi:hypothetical protein
MGIYPLVGYTIALLYFLATHLTVIPGALARRLEGSPGALVAHPSRLAVKNGEHLRMTAVLYGQI